MVSERWLRKLVPSTAVLSRSAAFYHLSLINDWTVGAACRLITKRRFPPMRYISRTGCNDVLSPYFFYLTHGVNFWLYAFAQGWANLNSRIVDIGSGCGKSAVALRDFEYMGQRFQGQYFGFDVDADMIRWCQQNFAPEHFSFRSIDSFSAVYNPSGASQTQVRLQGCDDGSIDLVMSQSLFSHLLEPELRAYVRESARVLRGGGLMAMTFFCMDDLRALKLLGGRWSFAHQREAAHIENERYPEAAVAYDKAWMEQVCREAGFSRVETILPAYQSTVLCVK
ncbi:MAG: class I SAM-dependent methyltransferase [Candidatus Korobacteraceae bacterium]